MTAYKNRLTEVAIQCSNQNPTPIRAPFTPSFDPIGIPGTNVTPALTNLDGGRRPLRTSRNRRAGIRKHAQSNLTQAWTIHMGCIA